MYLEGACTCVVMILCMIWGELESVHDYEKGSMGEYLKGLWNLQYIMAGLYQAPMLFMSP